MYLLKRTLPWLNSHRSGWATALHSLVVHASTEGYLLDDFTEASFSYALNRRSHKSPWIGVFHHPISVDSPVVTDAAQAISKLFKGNSRWERARPLLRGAVALTDNVTNYLRGWLKVPVLSIKHPAETRVRQWNAEKALSTGQVVQAGFFLRNTRLIFQIKTPGWERIQLRGNTDWYYQRDQSLRELRVRPEIHSERVRVLNRQDNDAYDDLLAESVVITELYGASANNLVIECMVRGTPLIINRLPAVEEYLGADYPLFYSSIDDIAGLLSDERLLAANAHLLERSVVLPTFDEFAKQIVLFVESIERNSSSAKADNQRSANSIMKELSRFCVKESVNNGSSNFNPEDANRDASQSGNCLDEESV